MPKEIIRKTEKLKEAIHFIPIPFNESSHANEEKIPVEYPS